MNKVEQSELTLTDEDKRREDQNTQDAMISGLGHLQVCGWGRSKSSNVGPPQSVAARTGLKLMGVDTAAGWLSSLRPVETGRDTCLS